MNLGREDGTYLQAEHDDQGAGDEDEQMQPPEPLVMCLELRPKALRSGWRDFLHMAHLLCFALEGHSFSDARDGFG